MARAISRKFEDLKAKSEGAFIPFVTAGDPDLETTIRIVPALERGGGHIVELGIPFSDPLADGPTIQRSSERALSHGYGIGDYLESVRRIRLETDIPVVLFSYYNPVLKYGLRRFAKEARDAGADGILVTDMVPEEGVEYAAVMDSLGLDPIFLVAPTSGPERIAKIVDLSRGFVYLVSRTGVTGTRSTLANDIGSTLRRVRTATTLPIAVGFGVSRPEHVQSVWEVAEAAVVGSALVSFMETVDDIDQLPERVCQFCRWLTGESHG